MAYFSSSDVGDSLDELICPVCFELYEEPIALPCGHSFCRMCIETSWESREEDTGCVCPNCREVFPQKPKLKKIVIIANLVENIKLKKREVGLGVEVRDAEHGGVKVKERVKSGGTDSYCEVCNREAAKRCVPCEILCCAQHLKPHKQKGHKLVDPGVKIEEQRCNDHGKPILLYCKDDGSLMCITCMGGKHQDHNVVGVEFALAELKLSKSVKKWLFMYYIHIIQSGRDAEDMLEEKRRRVCQFVNESVDLMKSQINKRKMEKLSLLGKQREKLEQQMESLRQGKSTMQTALQNLEDMSFLQVCGYKQIVAIYVFVWITLIPKGYKKRFMCFCVSVRLPNNVLRPRLMSLDGRTLSLDQNSAHPRIKVSPDLRTATLTGTEHLYPEHPDRFDYSYQVVSFESFSSSHHYWEVDVSLSSLCAIGICLNSMRRKGRGCGLGGNHESWCLWKRNHKYSAWHNNQGTLLSMPGDPERFGFFLDCEAGELTCFGDSRVLHVFRGNFMDPVKPAIGVYYPNDGSVRFFSF
uniref:Uncharacterized protein n=1 Tax=Eptatretus burgeri TaxID=7764 RepID=A0A8C4Q1G1_EPTBU